MTSIPHICERAALVALSLGFYSCTFITLAYIQPSRAILSIAVQLSGAMDPFLDHLERDDDVITNNSRTTRTVYAFILQEVMKPL